MTELFNIKYQILTEVREWTMDEANDFITDSRNEVHIDFKGNTISKTMDAIVECLYEQRFTEDERNEMEGVTPMGYREAMDKGISFKDWMIDPKHKLPFFE
tara:strand:- start:89 stop:391 length:303 start_codon:yes stop_codon:yes gene_type:complete